MGAPSDVFRVPPVVAGVIVFELGASGEHLVVETAVVAHLEAHRQVMPQHREAGGQLFAIFLDGSVIVKEATGPRPTDRRTRTSYRPDRKAEQQEILERHSLGLHYVGAHASVITTVTVRSRPPQHSGLLSKVYPLTARVCVDRRWHALRAARSARVGE